MFQVNEVTMDCRRRMESQGGLAYEVSLGGLDDNLRLFCFKNPREKRFLLRGKAKKSSLNANRQKHTISARPIKAPNVPSFLGAKQ